MFGEIGNPGQNSQTSFGWGWSNTAWQCFQRENGGTGGAGKGSSSYVRLGRSIKYRDHFHSTKMKVTKKFGLYKFPLMC